MEVRKTAYIMESSWYSLASTQIFFLGMGFRSQTLTKTMTFLLPLPEPWFQMSLLILSMFYFISGVSEFYGLITDLIPLFLLIWLKFDQSPTRLQLWQPLNSMCFFSPKKRYSNFLKKKKKKKLKKVFLLQWDAIDGILSVCVCRRNIYLDHCRK